MKTCGALKPKSFKEIRKLIPQRFTTALISGEYYDIKTGQKYSRMVYTPDVKTINSDKILFQMIFKDYRKIDEIVLGHEVYDGNFYFSDYIVLNELLNIRQKWELAICQSIFNGEHMNFELCILNKSKRIYYLLESDNIHFRDKINTLSKDMKLIELHLLFESLGGYHESKSKFTEIIERAGWKDGLRIIKTVLDSLQKLQSNYGLSSKFIFTKIDDTLIVDDDFIIYSMTPGIQNHEISVKHFFQESMTEVRLMLNGEELCKDRKVHWGN
jgi:hypothetical protein